MENTKKFEKELDLIKDPSIRKFAEVAIDSIPEQFWEVGASSTNKYHPSYASGKMGLFRHTVAATRIAVELFRMEMFNFTDIEKDLIIVSLILHDTRKHGLNFDSKFSVHEHPVVAANAVRKLKNSGVIPEEYVENIAKNIETHMGQWTTNKYSKVVLPQPESKMQKFVHLVDYLASRKCLEFNFDVEVSRD